MGRDPLDVVIERATRKDSNYWLFLDLEGVAPESEQQVETRLNMPRSRLQSFVPPPGWLTHRVDPDGIVYLRRRQCLTDAAVKSMITEMISLAYACDGQFWSWLHGSALDP